MEVLSPDDRAGEVLAKVQSWLDAGCRAVWVVDPRTHTVTVYRSLSEIVVLGTSEVLSGGDLLPEFRLPCAKSLKDDLAFPGRFLCQKFQVAMIELNRLGRAQVEERPSLRFPALPLETEDGRRRAKIVHQIGDIYGPVPLSSHSIVTATERVEFPGGAIPGVGHIVVELTINPAGGIPAVCDGPQLNEFRFQSLALAMEQTAGLGKSRLWESPL